MKRCVLSVIAIALAVCVSSVDAGIIRRNNGEIRGGRIVRATGKRIWRAARVALPPYRQSCESGSACAASCAGGACEVSALPKMPAQPSTVAPQSAPPYAP